VVNSSSAKESIAQNTRWVGTEVVGLSINWDWNRLLNNSCLQSSVRVDCNLSVSSYINVRCLRSLICAGAVFSSVFSIAWLVVSTVGLVVVEGVTLPATIAAVASLYTVNKLLLGESGHGWSSLVHSNMVGRLKSANGGESPAWAALALVLNGGNSTSLNPVDTGSEWWDITSGLVDCGLIVIHIDESIHGFSFFLGVVRQEVVGVTRWSFGGIEFFNLSIDLSEKFHSCEVLLVSGVWLALGGDKVDELEFFQSCWRRQGQQRV